MAVVREMLHKATVERCIETIGGGLDVHRWLDMWKRDGRTIDEDMAIAIYHSALQDARRALADLCNSER